MSTTSRSYEKNRDIKWKSIHLLGLLIVINSATAIDYGAYRRDAVPRGTHRQTSITTRNILEQLNRRNVTSSPTLQDATEHLLQYGALLRIQILDTFGKLVYDHYDDFGMHQIEALYRVYSETLERKYNIFDIVPSVMKDPDMRPTKICSHINKHVRTCLKESSQVCTRIKIHDEANENTYEKRELNSTRRIYRSGQISKNYPNGFSLKAVLHHLRAGRLRLTSSLFSGLLHNVQYDNFDDKVRTAERELVAYLGKPSTTWITRKLEKSMLRARKVSELLKNYLSAGSKLFAGRAADRASYLSKHVVREVDAVSENIELLGTVYDNSTINLKYLFELILPNDSVAPDVLEARDYLLRELRTKKIVETYLSIEKYQQNGPDQLLLEILGQLRDIGFAEDLVTSLYAHARFWHKSHMVENVNELLELFDAYENLRELKNYRGLVKISRVIKNNLRNSKNVTVELLCSRPRECLRIGLQLVSNCAIINERTKRAIEVFIKRTTYGCSYLKEDTVDEIISGEISEGLVVDQLKTSLDDDYLAEASGSGEQNDSRDASLTLMNSTKSIDVSKSSLSTSESSYVTPTETAPLTPQPEVIGSSIQNTIELSEKVGQSWTIGEPREKTTTEKSCADDCTLGECVGNSCIANHNTTVCNGDDCNSCNGTRNCSESSCEDGDCGLASVATDNCEGEDCEKDVCEGPDCSDRHVTQKIVTTSSNETTDVTSNDCEGAKCVTNTTPITVSPTACQGKECLDEKFEKSCEGLDCQDIEMKESKEGYPMDDCEGDNCSERSVAEPCKGADCSAEVLEPTSRPCTGKNCSQSVEICDGKDCTMKPQETTTELATTIEASTNRRGLTSTQQVPLPHIKPMIICNNSDPHYRRKLNRLRKIRLIDALSSKSMSSYEVFDKLLASTSGTKPNGPERISSKMTITDKAILTADLSEETPARKIVPAKSNLKIAELEKMRIKTKNGENKEVIVTNLKQASPKRIKLSKTGRNETSRTTKNLEKPGSQTTKVEVTKRITKNSEEPGLLLTNLKETSWMTKNPKKPRLRVTSLEKKSRRTENPEKPELPIMNLEETSWTTKNREEPKLQATTMEETSEITKNPRRHMTNLAETSLLTKGPKEPVLKNTNLRETIWQTKSPEGPELELEQSGETSNNPKARKLQTEELEETRWTMKNPEKTRLQMENVEETSWTTKNPKKPRLQLTDLVETSWTTKNAKKPKLQLTDLEETSWTTKNPKKPRLQVTDLEETIWTTKHLKKPRLQVTDLEETIWTTKNRKQPRLQVTDREETSWTTKNPKKPRLQVTDLEETIWTTKNRKQPRLQVTDREETSWTTKNPKKPRLQVTDLEETSWTTKNPKKPRLQPTDLKETSSTMKNPKKPRLQVTDLEETSWTTKNSKKPRLQVTDLKETSSTMKNPKKSRLQETDLEETSWTTKNSEKPRLQVTDLKETSSTMKNPKKPRLQVTDLEETSWITKNSKKPTLQVTELEEKSWITKNPKKSRLHVTDLEETNWTTKNSKKPRLHVTELEEKSWTTKNPKKPRLQVTDLEETSWTTKNPKKPRLQVTELEEKSWTTKNPKKPRLQVTDLEETSWTTKNSKKPGLQVTDLEETSWTTKNLTNPRLKETDLEETSWTSKNTKNPSLQVTDQDKVNRTTKNLSKSRSKVTILSKPSLHTKSVEETISSTNDRKRTASKAQNQRTTSFEVNGLTDTITEMKSLEKASSNKRNHRNDRLLELLRNKGKSSRSAVSTRGRANQQSARYNVTGSYEIGGSFESELEGKKSARQRSDLEGDDSLMEKNGSSENFSTTRHRMKSGSMKMNEGLAEGVMKRTRIVTSDGDDEAAQDSIRRETTKKEISRTIGSAGAPKRWHWSARKHRVRITGDDLNGHQSMISNPTLVKPGRHFVRRVDELQESNEETPTIKRVPKMHRIQKHESEFQAIEEDTPKIHKIRKWKIHEIGDHQPKIHDMKEHDLTIHEFVDGEPKIWENESQTSEIREQDPKIREEKMFRIRGRGSKIQDEALDDQAEVSEMEDLEPKKMTRKHVVRGETRKYILQVPQTPKPPPKRLKLPRSQH